MSLASLAVWGLGDWLSLSPLGEGCDSSARCREGLCVQGPPDVCAKSCEETACPRGWSCEDVTVVSHDLNRAGGKACQRVE